MNRSILRMIVGLAAAAAAIPPAMGQTVSQGQPEQSRVQDNQTARVLQSLRNAPDPSAVIDAYSRGIAIDPNSIPLHEAFIQRMIGFGLADMVYLQAQRLAELDSSNGLAWGVVAYVNALRGKMPLAVSAVILAVKDRPDDPFVQNIAGQLLAWYDQRPQRPEFEDSQKEALLKIRSDLAGKQPFDDGYNKAREEYEKAAAQEADSQPSPQGPAAEGLPPQEAITPQPQIVPQVEPAYDQPQNQPVLLPASEIYGALSSDQAELTPAPVYYIPPETIVVYTTPVYCERVIVCRPFYRPNFYFSFNWGNRRIRPGDSWVRLHDGNHDRDHREHPGDRTDFDRRVTVTTRGGISVGRDPLLDPRSIARKNVIPVVRATAGIGKPRGISSRLPTGIDRHDSPMTPIRAFNGPVRSDKALSGGASIAERLSAIAAPVAARERPRIPSVPTLRAAQSGLTHRDSPLAAGPAPSGRPSVNRADWNAARTVTPDLPSSGTSTASRKEVTKPPAFPITNNKAVMLPRAAPSSPSNFRQVMPTPAPRVNTATPPANREVTPARAPWANAPARANREVTPSPASRVDAGITRTVRQAVPPTPVPRYQNGSAPSARTIAPTPAPRISIGSAPSARTIAPTPAPRTSIGSAPSARTIAPTPAPRTSIGSPRTIRDPAPSRSAPVLNAPSPARSSSMALPAPRDSSGGYGVNGGSRDRSRR